MALYQHGDVLIVPRPIPERVSRLAHSILARGELTGHAHVLTEDSDAVLYEGPDGTLYLRVGPRGATVTHEEHGPRTIGLAGDYGIERVREFDHFAEEARAVID